MKKRKNPSADFKAKVALEAIREEMTLAGLSKKYGVRANQISTWKRAAIENMASAFTRRGAASHDVQAWAMRRTKRAQTARLRSPRRRHRRRRFRQRHQAIKPGSGRRMMIAWTPDLTIARAKLQIREAVSPYRLRPRSPNQRLAIQASGSKINGHHLKKFRSGPPGQSPAWHVCSKIQVIVMTWRRKT